MSDLLNSLPSTEDLSASLPQEYPDGGFQGMDTELNNMVSGIGEPPPAQDVSINAAVPANLSADRVTSSLQEPLSGLDSLSAGSLQESIAADPIDVDPGELSVDLDTPMTQIGQALTPGATASTPTVDQNMPGFESQEALHQLKKLAAASAATPTRLVKMFLTVFKTMIEEATDKEQLIRLTMESLEEIYLGQLHKLTYNLPITAAEDITVLHTNDFFDRYSRWLDEVESSTSVNFTLLDTARDTILPELKRLRRAHATLTHFGNGDVAALESAIEKVLEFTGEGEVVLQSFFDIFEQKVLTILAAVKPPVEAIKDGAESVRQFLEDTADKAEAAADAVTASLTSKLAGAEKVLSEDLTTKINEINDEINGFLDQLSAQTDSAVGGVKSGLTAVTDNVESFFEQVNDYKARLEAAVLEMEGKVNTEVDEAFKQAQEKIRELLNKIMEVLESPSVADALNKTKEGIDKFKQVMEEVSLQPVFDVIVTKTGELEVKVNAIQVDEMGVPGKTALKLGAKVLQEVKVDEIVKPELIAIFKELRDPIAALIDELKKGVLQINALIDQFEPGTIVANLLEQAGPYKAFINFLDTYRPSMLLAPLKEAYDKLIDLVDKLDPDILINKLQGLFDELYQLVDALSPAQLNTMITSAVNKVVGELRTIRDSTLDEIVATIKDTISLRKLLEGTGIEDIAEAEFWDQINYFLGGEFLVKIEEALDFVEAEIEARIKVFEFEHHEEEVAKMNAAIDAQLALNKTTTLAKIRDSRSALGDALAKVESLEARRKRLVMDKDDMPEYKDMLSRMDLSTIVDLGNVVQHILDNSAQIRAHLDAFAAPINAKRSELRNVDEVALELAATAIFRNQIGAPVARLITNIRVELEPFTEAVEAIRQIIVTVTELPARIDAKVAQILDAAVQGIKDVIDAAITAIQTASATIQGLITGIHERLKATLDKFSPMGLLNSFALTDLEAEGLEGFRGLLRTPGNGDSIALYMSTLLTAEQRSLLESDEADWQSIILAALNTAVLDNALNGHRGSAEAAISQKITALEGQSGHDASTLAKYKGLEEQLSTAATPTSRQARLRLNRMILEAAYPDWIKMSLQSLHPFIIAQMEQLYPEAEIEALDRVYTNIVDKVRQIPELLIKVPLNETYTDLKNLFQEKFDIEGVFKVLQVKLDGMDEDLEHGLDRVSYSFDQLIETFDERLSE